MINVIKWIAIWLWCFPQQIAGFIVMLVTRAQKKDGYYIYNVKSGSVSLGTFIFLCPSHWDDKQILKHESGHSKQSLMLGWLYLIIIGLPSLIWCFCFKNYRRKHNKSYDDFYAERWANKLGGVSES